MKKKSIIMRIGTPWIVPGLVIFLITNYAGVCDFKENDYLLSSYYNQTHSSYPNAQKYCNNINGQLELIGIIIIMFSLISLIIGLFPDATQNESKGTMPKG